VLKYSQSSDSFTYLSNIETVYYIYIYIYIYYRGNTTSDSQLSLYVERHDVSSDSGHVIATNDFFRESTVLLSGVEDFQLIDDYMFASKKTVGL